MTNCKAKLFYLWILPYLALVLIHILLGLKMQQPQIFSDEVAYLGMARYLSGAAHMIQGTAFYHFGYSLFLLPAFWIFSDPISVYKAVIITNSFIISSLYFPLLYVLHTLFNYPKKITSLASFTSCLYPAFVLQSNVAWSENAFIPFYALFIASFGALMKHKSCWAALLFASVSSFLYTIHPRALPILPITASYLCMLAWSKWLPKSKVLLSIIVMFLIFSITTFVNNYLLTLGSGSTSGDYIKHKLFVLFSPSNLAPLALKVSGQFLYLIEATYGLFFIGIVYIGINIWKKWSNVRLNAFADIQFNVMLMFILSSAGIFLASSVSILPVIRGDHLIYGRYNEGFLALYVAFALLAIRYKPLDYLCKSIIPYVISLVILILTSVILVGYNYKILYTPSNVPNLFNILGICPSIGILGKFDVFVVSVISILLLYMLLYAFRMKFGVGISLLIIYFLTTTACGYGVFLLRAHHMKRITTLPSHILSLGNINTVSYDRSYFSIIGWFSYQYLLPNIDFKAFSSSNNELPASPVVISGINWKDSKTFGAQLLAYENHTAQVLDGISWKFIEKLKEAPLVSRYHTNQALWLLPRDIQSQPSRE